MFGPESREQHDQVLRLDRVLGAFIDTLYALRDSSRIVFALTADHGGGLIPELHGRLRVDMAPAMVAARRVVALEGGDTTAVDFESGALFVDAARARADVAKVTDAFIAAGTGIPGVERADRFSDLARRDPAKDAVARRWLQMFPDDMLPVAVVTLAPGDIYNYPIAATHGSPHDYDSHVPIVFYGAPFKAGRYGTFVRTVDIAPTLARVLGVAPTEKLDGHVLTEAIR
jgi:arylsulfatase A-like enzyme